MKPSLTLLALQLTSLSHALPLQSNSINNTGSIHWHDCPTSIENNAGLDCAEFSVPLNWDEPNREAITLSMNRWPASDPESRIGNIVYNPGGPGVSAIEQVAGFALNATHWAKALRAFDLIGLDPRGVGRSSSIKCDPDLWNNRPSQFVHTEQDFVNLIECNRNFALSCQERTGDLVKHIDTPSVARDIDALRVALGEDKINFFGQSYGTQIGGSYAELFPNNFRAMVLDGNVDHSLTEIPVVVSEIYGYEVVWNHFVTWCKNTTSCVLHDQDIDGEFDKMVSTASKSPLPVPECKTSGDCRDFVRSEDITGLIQTRLDAKSVPAASEKEVPTWSTLAEILAESFKGNYTAFAPDLAMNESSHLWQMQLINCLDWDHNASRAADLIYQIEFMFHDAPHTRGTAQTYAINAICAGWPFPVPDPPHLDVVSATAAPVFLLNSFYDPETPFDQAVSLQRQLPGSVLVANKKDGHTTYQYAGEGARMVDAYLVNLTLPGPNTVVES